MLRVMVELPVTLPRRNAHRVTFVLAGIYNLGWGALAAAEPQAFFARAGLPPLNHPSVYQCLAMVVGLYGLVYLEIARRPERGWTLAAVGLLGKLLGPAGMWWLVARGTWPPQAAWLCLWNDLVWWAPFALYLRDAWPLFR